MCNFRKNQGMNWIRKDKRFAIYLRDNMACVYCGSKSSQLTLDHIVCKSKGGSNSESNLVTACHECNTIRNDTPLQVFLAKINRPDLEDLITDRLSIKFTSYRMKAKQILDDCNDWFEALETAKTV